jgi:pimeloyl-ACP methyl ester carboxylesterase
MRSMPETILILHGLMMRSAVMLPLALRLRRVGFAPVFFGYYSLWKHPELAMERLAARLRANGREPVHLVAHSLGGLVAAETLNKYSGLPPGRLVCLGSPIAGSAAARGLQARRLGFVSGRSGALLRGGVSRLPEGRDIGMIAGSRPLGLGRWFGGFEEDNDGTVLVRETRMLGLTEHTIVPVSHTGLVYSRQVAALTANFLRTGRFLS